MRTKKEKKICEISLFKKIYKLNLLSMAFYGNNNNNNNNMEMYIEI